MKWNDIVDAGAAIGYWVIFLGLVYFFSWMATGFA